MDETLHKDPTFLKIIRQSSKFCKIAPDEIYTIMRAIAGPIVSGSPVPEQPIAFIMCGPSGSGKSTLRNALLDEHNIAVENCILADPDRILSSLRQWSNPRTKMDCQKPAGYILTDFLLPKLAASRHHIIYDTTCRAIGNTMTAVDLFARNGYYVILTEIYVKPETSLQRVKQRAANAMEANKRPISNSVVREIYDEFAGKASVYYEREFKGKPVLVNELRLYNNEGDIPQLLYKRRREPDGSYTVNTVANGDFYFNYKKGGSKTKKVRRKQSSKTMHRRRRSQ
jgi:predicted ABC-type ATPase